MRTAVLFLLILFAAPSAAHEVRHEIMQVPAVVASLRYAGGSPLAGARYSIRREGAPRELESGRTDAEGRLVFVAPQAGTWRIKVTSRDGHGVELEVVTHGSGAPAPAPAPFVERHAGVIAGVGVILALFGVVGLGYCGKRNS